MGKKLREVADSPLEVNLRSLYHLAPSLATNHPVPITKTSAASTSDGTDGSADELYVCRDCGVHLCTSRDIVSRHFHGKHGKAFLTRCCLNAFFGPEAEKMLMTGLHIVRNVYCMGCSAPLGWTYDYAHSRQQLYKMNKYVLEERGLRVIQ